MGRAETHTFQWIMADSICRTPHISQQNLALSACRKDHLSISIRHPANQLTKSLTTFKMEVVETRTSRIATVDPSSLKARVIVETFLALLGRMSGLLQHHI